MDSGGKFRPIMENMFELKTSITSWQSWIILEIFSRFLHLQQPPRKDRKRISDQNSDPFLSSYFSIFLGAKKIWRPQFKTSPSWWNCPSSIAPVTGSLFDAKSRSKDSRDKSWGYRKRGISFCGTCHFDGSIVAIGHGCAKCWAVVLVKSWCFKVTFWDRKNWFLGFWCPSMCVFDPWNRSGIDLLQADEKPWTVRGFSPCVWSICNCAFVSAFRASLPCCVCTTWPAVGQTATITCEVLDL